MKENKTQAGQTVPLDSLVGYPMLLGKAMEPHFVVAENIKDAIYVVESMGWETWEFQHSNSYLIIANVAVSGPAVAGTLDRPCSAGGDA